MSELAKIDSNQTGLRFCEETALGTLPAAESQVWYPMEPNSYQNYGQQVKTVARQPINAGRQRKKGTVVDVEASGGFQSDLTQTNLQRLMQGFFFADAREKATTAPISGGSPVALTGVATHAFSAASGLDAFAASDLVVATGFTNLSNNGLKHVSASSSTTLTVSDTLVSETPPASSALSRVGVQLASGDAVITNSGTNFPTLSTTIFDLTTLHLIPGEWVFIGGDASGTFFATATDNGFARVRSVSAHLMTFDKTAAEMVTDSGAGKTIQIFIGRVIRNEQGTDIKRRTYTLERILGANNPSDLTKQQAEYMVGAVPNEFTMNLKMADKVLCDVTFMALHEDFLDENVSGANSLYSKQTGASAPSIKDASAFNTSSDIPRVNLSVVSSTDGAPTPLFGYTQDVEVMIKNNLKPAKAVGVVGAFEQTAGFFGISGKLTAYFTDPIAVQAIKNNATVSLDVHLVKENAGVSFDIPVITLGDGRLDVKQDEPILMPLTQDAGAATEIDPTLNYTALMMFWDYLPNLAA